MSYNPIDIFLPEDLKAQIVFKSINCDIVIRGEYIKEIVGVEKISGFLGISDSVLESLGDLIEIEGNFWTSFHTVNSPLKSLYKLEKIGGEASFRYSNIENLGNLKYVGGKLSLRDTPIENLGNLEFVGGDLYLPKRLKDKVDLSRIKVIGKIKFWNDNKTKSKAIDKNELGLVESKIEVPYWEHRYVFSASELDNASQKQSQFYHYFKDNFNRGLYQDIKGNDNYVFILFYDFLREYFTHQDIEKLDSQFAIINKYYPKTANYTSLAIIDEFRKRGDYKNAWKFTYSREYVSVQTIWEYERKLKSKLLNGKLITRLGGYSHLTD